MMEIQLLKSQFSKGKSFLNDDVCVILFNNLIDKFIVDELGRFLKSNKTGLFVGEVCLNPNDLYNVIRDLSLNITC